MADALLTINAGSSSIKFALFRLDTPIPAKPELVGQIRRHRRRAGCAPQGQGRAGTHARRHRPVTFRRSSAPCGARPSWCNWLHNHENGLQIVGVGHRVVHGARKLLAPDQAQRRPRHPPQGIHSPRAAAPAAQPRRHRGDARRTARHSADRLLRHRLPSHPTGHRPALRPAAPHHRARRAPLRLPRPFLRIHCRRAAAASRRHRPTAASSSPTSATAPRCAAWSAARARPRRWASPPSKA